MLAGVYSLRSEISDYCIIDEILWNYGGIRNSLLHRVIPNSTIMEEINSMEERIPNVALW
jgi:hypothetical protein